MTVIPSAAAAKRRTDDSAAASAWPARALVCTVAAPGSSVTSANNSPVVGSHTAHVKWVWDTHCAARRAT